MSKILFTKLITQAASEVRRSLLIGCGVGLFGLTQVASAQGAAQPSRTVLSPTSATKMVTVKLTQSKVLQENGVERLVDATSVRPGDVIEYTATYTNTSSKQVHHLSGDLPIPDGLEYLPYSAKPGAPAVMAATRNGVFAAEPLMHLVGVKLAPVAYADYHALRWNLGQLAAGAVTVVSARAKVETVPGLEVSPAQP